MIVLTVARGTVVESLRDRVLYLPVIFVLFILLGSLFLGSVSLGEMERVVVDFGLAGMTFFTLLTAVFLGVGWSYQAITRRAAYVFLAQPVHRRSVLWGAYLGLAFIQLLSLGAMGLAWSLMLALIRISWNAELTAAMALLYLAALLVTAMALFLSTVASPALAGGASVVLLLVGYGSRSLRDLAASFPDPSLRGLTELVYYVVPCLGNFTPGVVNFAAGAAPMEEILWIAVYGMSYTLALLALSAAVFAKRELP